MGSEGYLEGPLRTRCQSRNPAGMGWDAAGLLILVCYVRDERKVRERIFFTLFVPCTPLLLGDVRR
jgi:hypothetical protein